MDFQKTPTIMPYVMPLHELRRADVNLVGAKAANLGELAHAEFPLEVQAALRTDSQNLDGIPLAVRSSGVAEDLEGASFAGQYETILGVRGHDALIDAVRQCWASAFSARVAAYKRNKERATNASMAVLVQVRVDADAAGVAFTANPVF